MNLIDRLSARAAPFGAALVAEPLAPAIIGSAALVLLATGFGITADLIRPDPLPTAIVATSGVDRITVAPRTPAPSPSSSPSSSSPSPRPLAINVAPSPTATATATTPPAAPAAPAAPAVAAPPAPTTGGDTTGVVGIRIDRIGVRARTIDLGLESDGSLEVPSNYGQTGWWTGGTEPGQVGPAVIVGHISSRHGPAVFIDLDKLVAGDQVNVDFADGRVETFAVLYSARYRKDAFPTNLVYGPTDTPTLRLITCGGTFRQDVRSYDSNDVVFLQHVGTTPAR